MAFIFSWVLSWHEVSNFLTAAAIVKRQGRVREKNQYLNLRQPETSVRGASINWFADVFGLSKDLALKRRHSK